MFRRSLSLLVLAIWGQSSVAGHSCNALAQAAEFTLRGSQLSRGVAILRLLRSPSLRSSAHAKARYYRTWRTTTLFRAIRWRRSCGSTTGRITKTLSTRSTCRSRTHEMLRTTKIDSSSRTSVTGASSLTLSCNVTRSSSYPKYMLSSSITLSITSGQQIL